MKVIGLIPEAVRLDLQPCELPILVDELLTRIEAQGGALREENELHGRVSHDRLHDASDRLLEYGNLLAAISDDPGSGRFDAPVSLITPTAVADELVHACARGAAAQLVELLRTHAGDRERLRPAAAAAAAWTDTLVDLRYLDEEALEATGLA
jgi:hypothetical protein